jgi:hypothetical protein
MMIRSPSTNFGFEFDPKCARRKLVNFAMLRHHSPACSRHTAQMSNTNIRMLTLVLGGIVLLSSAIPDRDHRPPAGARTAFQLIADRLTDSRSKTAKSQAGFGGKWTLIQSAA